MLPINYHSIIKKKKMYTNHQFGDKVIMSVYKYD